MIKTAKYKNTFSGGVDLDSSTTKRDATHYLDAENFRIISNSELSSGSLSNVSGNNLKFSFESGDVIIGYCKIRSNVDINKDSIVFFVHNDAGTSSKIYLFEGDPFMIPSTEFIDMVSSLTSYTVGSYTYKSGYIYKNSGLNFSVDRPIKAEGRYESTNIRKIYWVDGLNNIRYMILDSINNTDPITIFDINPTALLSTPVGTVTTGGSYKAGMVQYSYQLYIKNGAATTYAPVSNLLYLTANDGGIDSRTFTGTSLGGNTGKAIFLTISGLDVNYNRIRIIAIHYTEYLTNPTINIVGELEYSGSVVEFVDNGHTIYGTVPIEEFRLFGQTNYIANSLAEKNNYLFFADLTEDKWNPTWLDYNDKHFFDTRAVRYRSQITNSHTDTIGSIDSYESESSVVMTKGGSDTAIDITITGFSSYVGIPTGRTLTNVTGLHSTCSSGQVIGGYWHDIAHNPTSFGSTLANTAITLLSYTYATDTLVFNVVTSSIPYFNVSYNHLNDCAVRLRDMYYDYSYTNITTFHDAIVTNAWAPTTIFMPVNRNSLVSWNNAGWSDYVHDHDGINDYNNSDNDGDASYEFKYQSDIATLGAEGPNLSVSFNTDQLFIDSVPPTGNVNATYSDVNFPYSNTPATTSRRSSQRTEVYRMFIVWYNTKMQYSNPQWICDLRMPNNNEILTVYLSNTDRVAQYIYPVVALKHLPSDPDLYGWQIFRCERESTDRSVMASGVVSACAKKTAAPFTNLVRPYSSAADPYCFIRAEDVVVDSTKNIIEIVSPEINFNKNLSYTSGDKLRIEGRYLENDSSVTVYGSHNYRLVTLALGQTYARHPNDTIMYNINDGRYEALGVIYGDPVIYPSSQSIGGELYKHTLITTNGGTKIYGNRGSSFIVSLTDSLSIDPAYWGFIYGSYVRNVFYTQYGGNTYEARSYNKVIPYSDFCKITDSTTNNCYNGDTHITMFAYLRSGIPDIAYSGTVVPQQEMVYIPCESSINCFYRLDPIQKYYSPVNSTYILQETLTQGIVIQPTDYPLELGDLYRYNSVYSRSGDANLIQCTIFDSNNIEHSDVKIIATGKKINNEYFDNWTNLYTNNNIQLDPKFGAIRNIFNFNNKLFAGQDKAISVIAVNDRSLIQDNSALQLTLGTGGVLDRFDYLTTTSGFQNYFDMVLSDKSFYYFDRRNKIEYTLTEKGDVPISEINGYRSFLKRFATISTVRCGYDPIYKEVFLYISDGSIKKNSIFNEYTNSFNGKHTFEPDLMFNLNDQFYSIKDNEVYLHNYGDYGKFYGTVSDSSLTTIINPSGTDVCRFDALDLKVDVIDVDGTTYLNTEQFNSIELSNSYQSTTKTIAFSGDDSSEDTSKAIARQWRVTLLPDDMSTDFFRFTDEFLKVKLIRDNTDNKKILLHDIVTTLRPIKN